ncbi:glycosyltransferase [Vibrio sp. RC27]
MISSSLFISWVKYQRRTKTIQERFNMEEYNLSFSFEKRNVLFRILGTLLKSFLSFIKLLRHDGIAFLQVPSVFLLYSAYLAKFFNSKLSIVVDGHNNLFYESSWSRFPFLTQILAKQVKVFAHNGQVFNYVGDDFKSLSNVEVVKDLVPEVIELTPDLTLLEKYELPTDYIFIPCGLGHDEPVIEMLDAIKMTPDISFVITKSKEQVLKFINDTSYELPSNLLFLGFVSEEVFNQILNQCNSILVLSTREGTQPSGAIEAMAARKSLIISDSSLTRELFSDFSVFCANDAQSISNACLASVANNQSNVDFDSIIYEYEKDSLRIISGLLNKQLS